MNIIQHHPWRLFNDLQRDDHRLLTAQLGSSGADSRSDWVPAVDIKETDDGFEFRADVPGVHQQDLAITLDDGVLSIEGSREDTKEVETAGFKRLERMRGKFLRRFRLPETASHEGLNADYNNGVLTICVPKQEKKHAHRIEITCN